MILEWSSSNAVRVATRAMVCFVFFAAAASVPGPAATLLRAQMSEERCRASGSGLSVDHVVIAVSDLDRAAEDFRSLGFTLKPGSLHSNGLLNAHVKFADGTALELMSLNGDPTDSVAAAYATFLQAGEGGAFLAIKADPARVADAARALDLPSRTTHAGSFTWVLVDDSRGSFDGQPSPVFFVSYTSRPSDPDSLLAHPAGVSGINSVRLDATDDLELLLTSLGAGDCRSSVERPAGSEARLAVTNAELVLHKDPDEGRRAAVRELTLYGTRLDGMARKERVLLDSSRTHGVGLTIVR
jgi:hypothetical protein